MNVMQIEITQSFTDKATNTFVCKGDTYMAYVNEGCKKFKIYDRDYRCHEIPLAYVKVLQGENNLRDVG